MTTLNKARKGTPRLSHQSFDMFPEISEALYQNGNASVELPYDQVNSVHIIPDICYSVFTVNALEKDGPVVIQTATDTNFSWPLMLSFDPTFNAYRIYSRHAVAIDHSVIDTRGFEGDLQKIGTELRICHPDNADKTVGTMILGVDSKTQTPTIQYVPNQDY